MSSESGIRIMKYECPICKKLFDDFRKFRKHLKSWHDIIIQEVQIGNETGSKPIRTLHGYVCKQCDKVTVGYFAFGRMAEHLRKEHNLNLPYISQSEMADKVSIPITIRTKKSEKEFKSEKDLTDAQKRIIAENAKMGITRFKDYIISR
jgi:predicted amino acid-binding ACT domain protein